MRTENKMMFHSTTCSGSRHSVHMLESVRKLRERMETVNKTHGQAYILGPRKKARDVCMFGKLIYMIEIHNIIKCESKHLEKSFRYIY